MLNEEQIITGCKKYKKRAQRDLYEKYSPVLYSICLRYSSNRVEADDVLQDGLIKIYQNIKQYSGKGSFEGWLKRIIINTAITHYRNNQKNRQYNTGNIEEVKAQEVQEEYDNPDDRTIITTADFSTEEILEVINLLPNGYRLVFNLYVIEGKSHKEISEILDIDINTSKSQLSRARKTIQKRLLELCKTRIPKA